MVLASSNFDLIETRNRYSLRPSARSSLCFWILLPHRCMAKQEMITVATKNIMSNTITTYIGTSWNSWQASSHILFIFQCSRLRPTFICVPIRDPFNQEDGFLTFLSLVPGPTIEECWSLIGASPNRTLNSKRIYFCFERSQTFHRDAFFLRNLVEGNYVPPPFVKLRDLSPRVSSCVNLNVFPFQKTKF